MSIASKPQTALAKLDLTNPDGSHVSAGPYSAFPMSATSKASALFHAKLSARIGQSPMLPRTPLDPDPLTGRLNIVDAPITPPSLTPALPSISPPSSADDELDNASTLLNTQSAQRSANGSRSGGRSKQKDLKDALPLLQITSTFIPKPRSLPSSPFIIVTAVSDGSAIVAETPLLTSRTRSNSMSKASYGADNAAVYPLSIGRTARRRALLDDDEAYMSDPGTAVSLVPERNYPPIQRGKHHPFPVRPILPLPLGQHTNSQEALDVRRAVLIHRYHDVEPASFLSVS